MSTSIRIRPDRMLEVNGRPFFPLQVRHVPGGAGFDQLAEVGFNCIRGLVFGHLRKNSAEPLPDDYRGLKLCAYLYDRPIFSKNAGYEKELAQAVRQLRDRSDLLAYEIYNEPAFRPDSPAVVNQTVEALSPGFQLLKRLDPGHPVHMGHGTGGTVEALRQYNAVADIIGCNPYPVFSSHMRRHIGIRSDGRALDSPDQSIAAVGDYTEKMVAVGRKRRPVWMQVQAMAWEEFYSPTWTYETGLEGKDPSAWICPDYRQLRFMAFNDIIHGATGLLFSLKGIAVDRPEWQNVSRVVTELQRLHDIIAGETWPAGIRSRYHNLGFSIWKGVRLLLKVHAGNRYLLAANNSFDPVEVSWSGLGQASAFEVLGENRRLSIARRTATDYFEPFGVHVYRMI